MTQDLRLTTTQLNRCFGEGEGIPRETEVGHFKEVLTKYTEKHNFSVEIFEEKYKNGEIQDFELDMYFVHDRSM